MHVCIIINILYCNAFLHYMVQRCGYLHLLSVHICAIAALASYIAVTLFRQQLRYVNICCPLQLHCHIVYINYVIFCNIHKTINCHIDVDVGTGCHGGINYFIIHYVFEHSCNIALIHEALNYNIPDSEVRCLFPVFLLLLPITLVADD